MSQARSRSIIGKFHWGTDVSYGSFGPIAACTRYAACAYSTSGCWRSVRATASASSPGPIVTRSKSAYVGRCDNDDALDAADRLVIRDALDAPSRNFTITCPGI